VLEGPRVVEGALDRGAHLESLYLGTGTEASFAELVARARRSGAAIAELKEGVLEKLGSTVTPQPVLAVTPRVSSRLEDLVPGLVLVGIGLADPGNVGTMIRTAEAVGAAGVVLTGATVDPYNPKAVRASTGAIVGTRVVLHEDTAEALEVLERQGRRRFGAAPSGGSAYSSVSWPHSCAIVLGNEAHGLGPELSEQLDELVTVPMVGGESLNVAIAATVLAYAWMQEQTR